MHLTFFTLPIIKEIVFIYIVIFVLIAVFLVFRKLFIKVEYPYYKNPRFMTDREKTFFRVLRLVDTDKFYISFQVGLMSLLGINKKGRERQIYFNKISRKSVDFVLISKESLNPVLAIELDDSSHLEISRQKRDEFVEKAMDVAGIPLLRVKNQSWYNVQELRSQIDKIIS